MSHIVHEIPYLDTRDINLDWLFKKQRELELSQADLEERQTILEEKVDALDIPKLLVKVEDYGAKGDGVTDDTAAIQKCCDENPGATIYYRKGTYCISSPIELYGHIGGQMHVLGGATIKWVGEYDTALSMYKIHKSKTGAATSACRIIGGNFDGNDKCGWCIETFGFYTCVSYCTMYGYTAGGLSVGYADAHATRSLQGKFSDLYIRDKARFSLGTTCAILVTSPDNEFSQIITDGNKYAFRLRCGGNSFVNCHTTVSFPGYTYDGLTLAEYEDTYHIYLDPYNSGETQINTFNGCYFNCGKYVLYSRINSRMATTIDSSYYIFYHSADLPFSGAYTVLCGGHPSDFRSSGIDIIIGGDYYVLDYFPTNAPTAYTMPDYMQVNSNDRHVEAPVYNASNRQPEHELTPIVSGDHPATLGTYYEVGAIMMCYDGAGTVYTRTSPVKLVTYNSQGMGEWEIGFEGTAGSLTPVVLDHRCSVTFNDLNLFISTVPDMITLEGITYPTYYIYLMKAAYSGIMEFLYMENNSPKMKCYIRAYVDAGHTIADITNTMKLPDRATIGDRLWDAGSGTNAVKMLGASSASGSNAIAVNGGSAASGTRSMAGGYQSNASGTNSLAFGDEAEASGDNSIALGEDTTANASGSVAIGHLSEAAGINAVALGTGLHATGFAAAGFNMNNTASGQASAALGYGIYATRKDQLAFGTYNDYESGDGTTHGTYVEQVGNGTDNDNRSNARTLDWSGNEELAGDLTVHGGGGSRTLNAVPNQLTVTYNAKVTNTSGSWREVAGIIMANVRLVIGTALDNGEVICTLPYAISGRGDVILVETTSGLAYVGECSADDDFVFATTTPNQLPTGTYRMIGVFPK